MTRESYYILLEPTLFRVSFVCASFRPKSYHCTLFNQLQLHSRILCSIKMYVLNIQNFVNYFIYKNVTLKTMLLSDSDIQCLSRSKHDTESQKHENVSMWNDNEKYPSSSPVMMFSLAKKAMCGKRRSWCVVNTRQANKLGSHMWLRKRLMFP